MNEEKGNSQLYQATNCKILANPVPLKHETHDLQRAFSYDRYILKLAPLATVMRAFHQVGFA